MRRIPVLLAVVAIALAAAPAQKRNGLRPAIWTDNDMASIPEPKEYHDSLYYDFLHSTFAKKPGSFLANSERAWNVNAWDEAPNSSWYTNRHHLRRLTIEEVRRGPNRDAGPDLSGPLTILSGKDAGTSPGFGRTRDARGEVFYLKFDSAEHPELSTASELIASRFYHAMGFSVPEQWIVTVRPGQFQVDANARIWDERGIRRKMTMADVDNVLKGVAKLPDGRYRAYASRQLPGTAKGRFLFHGTRKDDPNDLIPHQHRRELRGLRLMSAWLNSYDMRVGNTLDMYVEDGGRKYLRHYLQDVGSSFGAASFFPKRPRMGNSYIFDLEEMGKPLLTFGIYQPSWRERPTPIQNRAVGPFESARFDPADWKPVFPVPAFDQMDSTDAFWAAKIVMSFTPEEIRAAVEAGQISDPAAVAELVRVLVERQRKVGHYGFSEVNPLDRFRIVDLGQGPDLEFDDLAVKHGLADASSTWYYFTFGSPQRVSGGRGNGSGVQSTRSPRIPLAALRGSMAGGSGGGDLLVSIGARRQHPEFADKWIHVYLGRDGSGVRVLGWERER